MIERTSYYELEHTDIIDMKCTAIPCYKASPSGYGRKIPLSYMLKLTDKKWHRVYIVLYANNGTAYVQWKGIKYIPCEMAIDAYRIMKG